MKILSFALVGMMLTSAYAQSTKLDLSSQVQSQLPVANGGTGASTSSGALTNLGAQPVIPNLTVDGTGKVTFSYKLIKSL